VDDFSKRIFDEEDNGVVQSNALELAPGMGGLLGKAGRPAKDGALACCAPCASLTWGHFFFVPSFWPDIIPSYFILLHPLRFLCSLRSIKGAGLFALGGLGEDGQGLF